VRGHVDSPVTAIPTPIAEQRLQQAAELSEADLRSLLLRLSHFPDAALSAELMEIGHCATTAELQRCYALALAAVVGRVGRSADTRHHRQALATRALKYASMSLAPSSHGDVQSSPPWDSARLVVDRVALATRGDVAPQESREHLSVIRNAIENELGALLNPTRDYEAGVDGLRLAYLVGNRRTARLMLRLLNRFEDTSKQLRSRGFRYDLSLVDFSIPTIIRSGGPADRHELAAWANHMRRTATGVTRARVEKQVHAALSRLRIPSRDAAMLRAAVSDD